MLRKQAIKHPIAFGFIIILLFEIVMQGTAMLVMLFGPSFLVNNGDYVLQGTVECFVALAGIGIVALFGYNDIWGEKGKGFFKGIGIGGYFIYVQVAALIAGIVSVIPALVDGKLTLMPGWKIAAYIICFLLVGFAEEVFFRGLIANFLFDKHAKDPAGVWCATIWSGLLFGLLHVTNLLGSDPAGVLVQVIVTIAMGMALTAIYYRCRNIWVVIIIHAMNNICAGIASGFFEGVTLSETIGSYPPVMAITGSIPYVIVTAVLLRPKKLREIIVRDENEELTSAERITRYQKSKISRSIAAVVTIAVCVVLFLTSCTLAWDGTLKGIFGDLLTSGYEYNAYETWSGEDYFTKTDSFVAKVDGDHSLSVMSYPGDSKVYVKLIIADAEGNEVFSETYGGRCSDTATLELSEGITYSVTIEYDFSEVTDGASVDYTTIIIIN